MIQTSLQVPQGVSAPSSAELNVGEGTVASLDWLADEEAGMKKNKIAKVSMQHKVRNRL